MNHYCFWPGQKEIDSCLLGPNATVIHDSYFFSHSKHSLNLHCRWRGQGPYVITCCVRGGIPGTAGGQADSEHILFEARPRIKSKLWETMDMLTIHPTLKSNQSLNAVTTSDPYFIDTVDIESIVHGRASKKLTI